MDVAPLAHSIPEACRLIGVGRTLIYELIKSGQLTTVKFGRRRLIPAAAIRSLIDAKVTEAA